MDADELRRWKKQLVDDLFAVRDGRKVRCDPERGIDDVEKELKRVLGKVKSRLAYFERIEAERPDPRKEAEEGTTIFHRQLREAYAELDEPEAAGRDADPVHARIGRLLEPGPGRTPHRGRAGRPSMSWPRAAGGRGATRRSERPTRGRCGGSRGYHTVGAYPLRYGEGAQRHPRGCIGGRIPSYSWIGPPSLRKEMRAMRGAVFALAAALLAQPATAQQLEFDAVVDLMLGTDSLAPGDTRPEVTENGRGGWFVAGLQLEHKWAEFGPDGELIRAPGMEWETGGPGEFRSIEFVLPLQGDTVLVVDRSRLVWTLRDGTYLRQEILPFRVREYAMHADRIWLIGSSLRSLAVWGLDASGSPENRLRLPVSDRTQPTAHPVSAGRSLWLWEYPRGPLHQLDPEAGHLVESINPFPDRTDDEWRAFARPGPSGTLLFDFVDLRRMDQRIVKTMHVDGEVREWAWPREGDYKDYFAPGQAWSPAYVQDPIELWAGVRIYRVTLPAQRRR